MQDIVRILAGLFSKKDSNNLCENIRFMEESGLSESLLSGFEPLNIRINPDFPDLDRRKDNYISHFTAYFPDLLIKNDDL
jgi:hypothetical protein